MNTDMKHFEKFVELAVTEALKSDPCGTQAFYDASTKMADSFAALRKSGFEFGPWKRDFDDLFLQPVNASVLDVHCVIWVRCLFPGDGNEGLRGWIPCPRGSFTTQVRHYAVTDDQMLATASDEGFTIGPLALKCPVLELLGNATNADFHWLLEP